MRSSNVLKIRHIKILLAYRKRSRVRFNFHFQIKLLFRKKPTNQICLFFTLLGQQFFSSRKIQNKEKQRKTKNGEQRGCMCIWKLIREKRRSVLYRMFCRYGNRKFRFKYSKIVRDYFAPDCT